MEIGNFFKLLRKYRIILVLIPLITVIGAFFLVKNLPDSYVSHAQIATGIVDASRHLLDKDDNINAQQAQVYREFSNLMAIMKLKKLINQVSYQLIIHDLSSRTPFRKYSKDLAELHPYQIERALAIYKTKLQHFEPLSRSNPEEDRLNNTLISMQYDEASILKNLLIYRDDDSDFISISFESENPELSAFIVNTLCKEFISYYTQSVRQNESTAVNFLSKLLDEKREALNKKTEELQQYKIQNGVLSLDEQSKAIYAQILTYNDRKQQTEKDIISNEGAINSIDAKFKPGDRKYLEAAMTKYNEVILSTQDQLHVLQDKYVRSGFDPRYKASIDSAQNVLAGQVNQTSDKYITNPLTAKDELVHQKLGLEISRDLAKYSVKSIDRELANLNSKFSRLVPFDATVKTYNFAIDIASKEYLEVLNKYNETNLKSNFSIKLLQVEVATPDKAQPSKKIFLVAFCAIISIAGCLLVLFVLFYLDKSVRTPVDLVNKTQLPLIGYLNRIDGTDLDLKKLWDVEHRDKMKLFKEQLRSIRFEIDQELQGEKVLAITSIDSAEGKTLLAISLAYSYSMINKKVLLIDGNFNNPTISKTISPNTYVENFFKNAPSASLDVNSGTTTVLGNRGEDITLLEIGDETFVNSQMDNLRSKYDIIIIDTPPLNSLNKSKEWILFANKALVVFESGKKLAGQQMPYVSYLRGLKTKFAGWVLNKANLDQNEANAN
ncbi:exopolysaccharide transport family protein [Mucilaginibacter pocheonensis]|uniref:Capsular polysaccharide biosynthesis protein/Mrp family chromosome partitioning ATPase n=1 Tax=Mucilaginibacter pocheonensis TaxID=398050 RepID=A0ABU1TDT5_9SPHI|nr:AAA family ATPase [Mucilaginibacter pocheonensis]MDR6943566.1 capsular polysaccharide biosynthesis protein/Mrp family chromosome partitioning ATPase [Mucilaginibacter pocheonensis]